MIPLEGIFMLQVMHVQKDGNVLINLMENSTQTIRGRDIESDVSMVNAMPDESMQSVKMQMWLKIKEFTLSLRIIGNVMVDMK